MSELVSGAVLTSFLRTSIKREGGTLADLAQERLLAGGADDVVVGVAVTAKDRA